MRRIFKYELTLEDVCMIESYNFFDPLCVKVQNGKPVLYAIVDDETDKCKHRIEIYGTGFKVDEYIDSSKYIGTFMLNDAELVFHVFINGSFLCTSNPVA